ncbi:hypothetical protein HK405_006138 [Cladochytrium tenue]|nr:hypothetical protein HK405_006138 [Cladochytrium tenue]
MASTTPSRCVRLTGSASCPSYATSYFFAATNVTSGTGVTSVDAFDVLVNKTVYGYPGSLLYSLGCASPWKPPNLRYAYAFFCEYFLNQADYIGGDPGGADDCNTVYSGRTKSISNSTCSAFVSSLTTALDDTTICPTSSTATDTRTSFLAAATALCESDIAVGDLNGQSAAINITSDALEGGLCGYGSYPYANDTSGLESAYNYCSNVNLKQNPCCTDDANVLLALDTSHVFDLTAETLASLPTTYSTSCTVVFNRFFTPACSNVAGFALGLLLIIISSVLVAYGVRRQDPAAMRQTTSGKYKEDTKWVASWWRNSPFSNTAYATMRKRNAAGDPSGSAPRGIGGGAGGSGGGGGGDAAGKYTVLEPPPAALSNGSRNLGVSSYPPAQLNQQRRYDAASGDLADQPQRQHAPHHAQQQQRYDSAGGGDLSEQQHQYHAQYGGGAPTSPGQRYDDPYARQQQQQQSRRQDDRYY